MLSTEAGEQAMTRTSQLIVQRRQSFWLVLLGVPLLGFGALLFSPLGDFWNTTPYCPWNHRIGFTPQSCWVADEKDGRVLVQHADLDVNVEEVSIHQGGSTRWIAPPPLEGGRRDRLRFHPTDDRLLLLDGEPFPITPAAPTTDGRARYGR